MSLPHPFLRRPVSPGSGRIRSITGGGRAKDCIGAPSEGRRTGADDPWPAGFICSSWTGTRRCLFL